MRDQDLQEEKKKERNFDRAENRINSSKVIFTWAISLEDISLVGNVRILPGPRFYVATTLASISLPPFAASNY